MTTEPTTSLPRCSTSKTEYWRSHSRPPPARARLERRQFHWRVPVGEVAAVCHRAGIGPFGWICRDRAYNVTVLRVRNGIGVRMSRVHVLLLIAGGAVAATASAHHG